MAMSPSRCLNFGDLRALAMPRLPAPISHPVDSGSDDARAMAPPGCARIADIDERHVLAMSGAGAAMLERG